LNRGVGQINETAAPGGSGNSGIARHWDGFFRPLKDIAIGDAIELVSAIGTLQYEVRKTAIVEISETGVLTDRGKPTLTLVTCFPFYFVGMRPNALSSRQGRRISVGLPIPAVPNQTNSQGQQKPLRGHMNPKHIINELMVIAVAAFLTPGAGAQVQTSKSVQHGPGSIETTVEHAEVVHVSGNDLIVKMDDGTIRDFPNVSETTKVDVAGKQLSIHELKPGMKLEHTITTTTTPRVVTTVQTVKGKVFHTAPPVSVILTLEDGTNQQFTIPKDQKFNVDGKDVDAFGLRKGMVVSATKVVEVPETVVSQQRKLTGTMPPPPPAPAADQPVLIVLQSRPAPAPTRAAARPEPVQTATAAPASSTSTPPAANRLPKTGSNLPLIGLMGVVSLALGGGLSFLRRRRA
jgi:LPXTG-site transpeptidase (sortase) family protein